MMIKNVHSNGFLGPCVKKSGMILAVEHFLMLWKAHLDASYSLMVAQNGQRWMASFMPPLTATAALVDSQSSVALFLVSFPSWAHNEDAY